MGGFFLHNSDETVKAVACKSVFEKKGFSAPLRFRLGSYRLSLYPKQMVDTPNFIKRDEGTAIFATGAPIYKGVTYTLTLETLLKDHLDGVIDYDGLVGNYAIIFWANGRIRILTDPLNVQHVFHDREFHRISTSFLAMLCSFGRKLSINRMAFYEKVAKGYILGPDTLVEDIFQWAPRISRQPESTSIEITSPPIDNLQRAFTKIGFSECIERQVDCLNGYMETIDALCGEYGAELGLSSGYDSRLLYAASKKLSKPLALHTHWTEGVHDGEQALVAKMAALRNARLHKVKTLPMKAQEKDRFAQILEDGLYFFDGRCAHNMGAFSETYTREYKIRALAQNRVSLNGLGGEIYRNYYFSSRSRFDFKKWFWNHVYYVFTPFAFRKPELLESIYEFILPKMEFRLDVGLKGKVGLAEIRRYYSELRMPDCDGINHNAHNQLAFFLTPFIEPKVIEVGYAATPHIGVAGRFQSALLCRIDPAVASIGSHYGFALAREPWTYKVKAAVKGYLPDSVEMARKRRLVTKRNLGGRNLDIYRDLVSTHRVMRMIDQALNDCFPEIDWQMCMCDYAQSATAIFLGSFLSSFDAFLKAGG